MCEQRVASAVLRRRAAGFRDTPWRRASRLAESAEPSSYPTATSTGASEPRSVGAEVTDDQGLHFAPQPGVVSELGASDGADDHDGSEALKQQVGGDARV